MNFINDGQRKGNLGNGKKTHQGPLRVQKMRQQKLSHSKQAMLILWIPRQETQKIQLGREDQSEKRRGLRKNGSQETHYQKVEERVQTQHRTKE